MPKTGNRDLKNHAYQIIKERLINCIYEPGSFINESQLATDLGLSRTPVREAINRLESEGLVKVMPKKGFSCQIFSSVMSCRFSKPGLRSSR